MSADDNSPWRYSPPELRNGRLFVYFFNRNERPSEPDVAPVLALLREHFDARARSEPWGIDSVIHDLYVYGIEISLVDSNWPQPFLSAQEADAEVFERLVTDVMRELHATELPGENMSLVLTGDPTHISAKLRRQLREADIDLREDDVVDGDYVVFCVSATQGPGDGTFRGLGNCTGYSLMPIAFLVTDTAAVDDPELIELVHLEMAAIVGTMIDTRVQTLPLIRADDAEAIAKIRELTQAPVEPVKCKRPDRAAYMAGFTPKPAKPWWKFW